MTREQFISLVETHQKDLRRFLCALCCGDAMLADDIAQESFMKAFLASDSLGDISKFKGWMLRIACNTFLTYVRNERKSVPCEDAAAMLSDYDADTAFRYQHLHTALESLSLKERTAVALFYLEGYSVKEISGITGSTQLAVKQLLSRGRKHLKNILSPN